MPAMKSCLKKTLFEVLPLFLLYIVYQAFQFNLTLTNWKFNAAMFTLEGKMKTHPFLLSCPTGLHQHITQGIHTSHPILTLLHRVSNFVIENVK